MKKLRHLITLKDMSNKDIKNVLTLALAIKKNQYKYSSALKNKTLVMLFEKTSTRTRLSFETAMTQLGGHGIFLDKRTTQFAIADFKDEIRATMRFGDVLMYRSLEHQSLLDAKSVARIPIINACSEKYHPCQALGDALTMIENCGGHLKDLKGKKVVWLGIGNNVSNSLVHVCVALGANITLCIAEKNKKSEDRELYTLAKKSGLYTETTNLNCLKKADFVHTDTWIDMEFFDEKGKVIPTFKKEFTRRKKKFMQFQLCKALLDRYKCVGKLMHCMPCHVGYEITRDAFDHPQSIILDQAENRLHVQKAILLWLLGKA
jgi:ornithine carbamoyltransferase